jgi:general secretion pathway protein D
LLNTALASVNATLIEADNYFIIKRLSDRADLNQVQFLGDDGLNVGANTRIVPLQYVSANSLESVFASLPGQSVSVSSDKARNLLILNSDTVPLDDLAQIAGLFDQNWLSEMSFAATPVKFTAPEQIISELEQILGTENVTANQNMLRFLALPRLNAVVSISRNPEYLQTAEAWIQRLDRNQTKPDQKFLIIPVQHRDAEEVADLLTTTFSDLFGLSAPARANLPNLEPGASPAVSASVSALSEPSASTSFNTSGKLRISTDKSNNTIIAYAHPDHLDMIEAMVHKIDVAPEQIYLETTIAEVTLNNDLAFGLSWFFENGDLSGGYSDIASGAVGNRFPGFSALISGPDARLALSAVSSLTDVKVLSSPSIMVLDNKTATLQVGDQVPIVTQSSVSVGDSDAPIINSVSLRDTGIILNVTPRVNDEGTVVLDIEQEVSNVISTVSSGIDSPTIQQRRLTTTVMVENGKSVALGGLIRERVSDNELKVPVLGDIPIIGPAMFKSENDVVERTELLLLITPKVVRSDQDGLSILKDLADEMSNIELSFSTQNEAQDVTDMEPDDGVLAAS